MNPGDHSLLDKSIFFHQRCLLPTKLISASSPFNQRGHFASMTHNGGDSLFNFDQNLIFTPKR